MSAASPYLLRRVGWGMGIGVAAASAFHPFSRFVDSLGLQQRDFSERLQFPFVAITAGDSMAGALFVMFVLYFLAPVVGLVGGLAIAFATHWVAKQMEHRSPDLSLNRSRLVAVVAAAVAAALMSAIVSPVIGSALNIVYFALIAGATEVVISGWPIRARQPRWGVQSP